MFIKELPTKQDYKDARELNCLKLENQLYLGTLMIELINSDFKNIIMKRITFFLILSLVLLQCRGYKSPTMTVPMKIDIPISDWKIKSGDDMQWARSDYDDTAWNITRMKQKWQDTGYIYTGYIWYRKHLIFDSRIKAEAEKYGYLNVNLGEFDDVAELFINGDSVGQYGQFAPDNMSAPGQQSYFFVSTSTIKWDSDNIIAVRLYSSDTIGGGMFTDDCSYMAATLADYLKSRVNVFRTEPLLKFRMQIRFKSEYDKALYGSLSIKMLNVDSTKIYSTSRQIEIKKGMYEENIFDFEWDLPRFDKYILEYTFDDGKSKYSVVKNYNYDKNPYLQSDLLAGIKWLSEPLRYQGSEGDTWICTWADDDNIYTTADDCWGINPTIPGKLVNHLDYYNRKGFQPKAFPCNSNLSINCIEGNALNFKLSTINCMQEYGKRGQVDGVDTWKADGLISIDGVLYMCVSQHSGAGAFPDKIQRAYDASIIKSYDHGKTWSPRPKVGKAMFPSSRFATPFFVQFGKDYKDATDDYVYAVSNIGAWNNGNAMFMARVKKDKIADLNATDWEFFSGYEKDTIPVWRKGYKYTPASIFKYIGHSSMAAIQYIPALNRFILLQWCYTDLEAENPWAETTLHLYEAKKPWGPYKHFYTEINWGNALYNAVLPSKWFEDGGMKVWMVSSGDFARVCKELSYCFTQQKMQFILK